MRNEQVLRIVKEKRNITHTTKKRAIWSGHILCRNCLRKHIIEGNIEGTGRRGRGRKQLLDDLTEKYKVL